MNRGKAAHRKSPRMNRGEVAHRESLRMNRGEAAHREPLRMNGGEAGRKGPLRMDLGETRRGGGTQGVPLYDNEGKPGEKAARKHNRPAYTNNDIEKRKSTYSFTNFL